MPCKVCDCEVPPKALRAFMSLGCDGKHPSNSERDLRRWLKRLWGLDIESYTIWVDLQVARLHLLLSVSEKVCSLI